MKITFRRGEKPKKITTNQLECLKILFEKSLILVVITSLTLITLFATLALPRANASENYRFDTIGNKGAQFQLSDTPNKVYSCLNKDSYLPELRIAHFRNDVYEELVISNGQLSATSNCEKGTFQYNFNLLANSSTVSNWIKQGFSSWSSDDHSIFVLKAYKEPIELDLFASSSFTVTYTFDELYPLPLGYLFGLSSKSVSSSSQISKVSVVHDLDSGRVTLRAVFRNRPATGLVISVVGSANNYSSKSDSNLSCATGMGWAANYPKSKISNSDWHDDDTIYMSEPQLITQEWKPSSFKFDNKNLTVVWTGLHFKAKTSRYNGFETLPTCFAVGIWKTNSTYSKGTNCSGSIINGFANLNCQPYEGWSKYLTLTYSLRILLDKPKNI